MATVATHEESLAASKDSSATSSAGHASIPAIPSLFALGPPIRDALITQSSQIQDDTAEECMLFLTGHGHDHRNVHGVPPLLRHRHVKFLQKQLGTLPPLYKTADPSRPWLFYWCLAGLALLGENVAEYRSRLIDTLRPMQNETGGIAGGFGQTSHLATTYAAVLSLALVGGEEAYRFIDRRNMWEWLCSLKQPDGGFQMAIGGEEDVRGAYCASVIISLLNIPRNLSLDSPARGAGHTDLFDGLPEWVGRCQTYEGGVSAAPGLEAHGAYAFCALACLAIVDTPCRIIPKYLDMPRLLSWLSSRQHAPEGGFSGRTNKLVDGCYSHWVGGCWPLIEASLRGPEGQKTHAAGHRLTRGDISLFQRDGLIRYILSCCQDLTKRGGLRDKPGKFSDAYHTCYVLSGLSSAQHQWTLVSARANEAQVDGDEWCSTPYGLPEEQIFEEVDRVGSSHPVYVIPQRDVNDCQKYFASRTSF